MDEIPMSLHLTTLSKDNNLAIVERSFLNTFSQACDLK